LRGVFASHFKGLYRHAAQWGRAREECHVMTGNVV
jgi:hypothetical protein